VILPILFVYVATRAFWWATSEPWFWDTLVWMDIVKVAMWVPASILMVKAIRGGTWRDTLGDLGLTSPQWRGTRLALAATVPMAAMMLTSERVQFHPESLLGAALLGPMAEEVLYRGFLFQQLWHRARWPVWAAALVSALMFALAHHPNLFETLAVGLRFGDLGDRLAVLGPRTGVTVAGGCLFAWVTWRWRSLWPAIALHGAINFWWDLAPNSSGSLVAGTTQGIALGLIVVLTWRLTSARSVRLSDQTLDRDASSPPASPPAR